MKLKEISQESKGYNGRKSRLQVKEILESEVKVSKIKNLDYYMHLPYQMVITPDPFEGGYIISFPDLRGCLTCGETFESLLINAEDAKKEWLLAELEEGHEIPEPFDDYTLSNDFVLHLPKSLKESLKQNARSEGISMHEYCIYLLAKNNAEQIQIHSTNSE